MMIPQEYSSPYLDEDDDDNDDDDDDDPINII